MTGALTRALCPAIKDRIARTSTHQLRKGAGFPNVVLTRYENKMRKNFETTKELMGRRVVVFTVPGAFTPTCTSQHLAGFKERVDNILRLGAGKIICIAPDKVDVAHAWNELHGDPRIDIWADNLGELTDKMGLGINLSGDRGLGYGIKRSAMVINALEVEWIEIEDDTASCVKSHAKNVYDYLLKTSLLRRCHHIDTVLPF